MANITDSQRKTLEAATDRLEKTIAEIKLYQQGDSKLSFEELTQRISKVGMLGIM